MYFEMTNVRQFLKEFEKKVQIEYKNNAFSMNQFLSKFSFFFHWLLFSRNCWVELNEEKTHKHQTKVASIHKFKHLFCRPRSDCF